MAGDLYQPKGRYEHSTETIGENVYMWGGCCAFTAIENNVIDVFNLRTGCWTQQFTTGPPPYGLYGYASTTIDSTIYYFGGSHVGVFSNTLHGIDVRDMIWKPMSLRTSACEPMKKRWSSMIAFEKRYLFTFGGTGPNANSTPGTLYGHYFMTNENHVFDLISGQWKSPNVIGSIPPPCCNFTLNLIRNNKVILCGGKTETGYIDSVYMAEVSVYCVNWYKLNNPSGLRNFIWRLFPGGRYGHTVAVINEDTPEAIMMMIGGYPVYDCWIYNVRDQKWKKISLPDEVSRRFSHSASYVTISPVCVWFIVFGGNKSDGGLFSDTRIVELLFTKEEWTVGSTWKLSTNRAEYLRKLGEKQREGVVNHDREIKMRRGHKGEEDSNVTLVQQLDELQQEIVQIKLRAEKDVQQANISLKETQQTLQEVIENHHHEIQQCNTRLQEKQQILQETQKTLQYAEKQVKELNQTIIDTWQDYQQLQKKIQKQEDMQDTQEQELKQTIQTIRQDYKELQKRSKRKEDTIQEQQQEIYSLRAEVETPHWVVQRDEVQMTQEVLGRGGYGEVRVGIFRGTKVAVKCLHEVILSEYNCDLFSREMDIASYVRHPNLLQFIGATRVGSPVILTELMPTSLRKEMEKSPLTRLQILTISCGVASALNYLHLWKPHPILHRDVNSANVLLEPSGNGQWKGKLCDYGSANFLHRIHTISPGNPAYAAPESEHPNLHSPAMDVYSFGVLFIEMVTHRIPSGFLSQQIQSIQWPSIKSLIEDCTSHNPQFRPTINQVLQDLKNNEI